MLLMPYPRHIHLRVLPLNYYAKQMVGIEPTYLTWQASVLAVILHLHKPLTGLEPATY